MEEMLPFYRGFKGSIEVKEKEPGKYDSLGCLERTDEKTVVITELPVKTWTQNYKEFLEELLPKEGRKADSDSDCLVSDYREYHSENSVRFEVTLSKGGMKHVDQHGLEKIFRLSSSIGTSNMVLFDAEGKIKKYATALEIMQDFCTLRKEVYKQRKDFLVAKLSRDKEILTNKAKFIQLVVKGELEIRKRKKADLLAELQKKGFKTMRELETPEDLDAAESEESSSTQKDFDYLLSMNLWSLTSEKVEELMQQHDQKDAELASLTKTTIEEMWERDLEALSQCLDELDVLEQAETQTAAAGQSAASVKATAGKSKARATKKETSEGASAKKPVKKQKQGA